MAFKYNFVEDTKFFFGPFHRGTVNIILHVISFTIMFIGLFQKDLVLTIIGAAIIDEIGHIYNYWLFKWDPKYSIIRIIPYQIFYGLPPFLLLLKIFRFI